MLETQFVGIEGKGKWVCGNYLPFLDGDFFGIIHGQALGWKPLRINSNSPVQVEHEQSEVSVILLPSLL